MDQRSLGKRIAPHLILILFGLMFLAPFAWLLLTTFKSEEEIFVIPVQWFPSELIWDNYLNAVSMIPFVQYTMNTVIIALLSVAGVVVISPLVAYGFSRMG